MEYILGIDLGGSTTKIVAFNGEEQVVGTLQVQADNQITSLYGAIGHLLYQCRLSLQQVSKIVLTGVGASWLEGDIYGISTCRVKEFEAIGSGGLALTGLPQALVVSMGTGTAFVRASQRGMEHVGGSGVGGGTLLGLAEKWLGVRGVQEVAALAEQGKLDRVDLSIGDISNVNQPFLPACATAANFGKIRDAAGNADMALGLLNMIFQTIGTLAVFACRDAGIQDIVATGTLATLPQARRLLDPVGDLYGFRFLYPADAVFATAIGAALVYFRQRTAI